MAQRKSLDTGPHVDGGTAKYKASSAALPPVVYNSLIRLAKRGDFSRVEQLRAFVSDGVARLKIISGKAIAGVPEGSDQVDIASIGVWIGKIKRRDRKARKQLADLAATLGARFA